jgi:hypothetical protein
LIINQYTIPDPLLLVSVIAVQIIITLGLVGYFSRKVSEKTSSGKDNDRSVEKEIKDLSLGSE